MANTSQYMTSNTAHAFGGDFAKLSWHDLLHPHIETQSAQEIVADVVARAGLKIV